jgi:hypothetical protein
VAGAASPVAEAGVKRLACLVCVALVPATAHADYGTDSPTPRFAQNAPKNYSSPQHWAFELKFAPYVPHIDSSPGLTGKPFSEIFNKQGDVRQPDRRLLTEVELDFQFWHKFGSLAVAATGGYYRRTSHSFEYASSTATSMTPCVVPNCTRSGDTTALNIIPLSLSLVYRFDVLALRYRVPLVPYVKIGLAYYIWIIENGGGAGSIAFQPGQSQTVQPVDDPHHLSAPLTVQGTPLARGYGGTFGWTINPGISLLLDVIDPAAARTIDAELGINHSYLFVELNYADISGFGQSNRLVLSDTTFNAGLAFEF